jgi:hypothetical protein
MALPYWYYRGRTTTPIKTAAEGPVVLVPRQKFYATSAEVAHLRSLGLVVPAKAPAQSGSQEPKKEAVEKKHYELEAQPKSEQKPEIKSSRGSRNEPVSEDDVIASGEGEEGEGEGGTSSEPTEKEKEVSRKGRRGQRRY